MYSILNKYIKGVALIGFLSITFSQLSAQVDAKIGNNPGNKQASAVLELESTTKGFLLPRMTSVQMNAIASPANGLAVYNTDQQCTYLYRGTAWVSLCDSATNGLTRSGSVISLGGALTGATTITTSGSNTLAISGLQGGSNTDSVVVLDAATGVIKKRTVTDLITDSGTTWLLNGNTLTSNATIGTNSNHSIGIETNGTTRLTITNTGDITQSGTGQVTFTGNVDATSGLDVSGGTLTSTAGSTLTGTTNINTTGSSTTTIGNSSSAVNIAGTTSVTGATNINTSGTDATNIGNSTSTTNIAGNTLNVTNTPTVVSATGNNVMIVDNTTGQVSNITPANLVGGAITANNGLTKNTSTNIQLGGPLVQNTSITQAGFDMNISGGNVAIGSTSAPSSTLQVTGSQAVSYSKKTSNYTLTSSDYIVMANASSGGVTLTLPAASSCPGRVYYVGKTDETTNTVTFSPAIYLTESTTITSINFAKKYKIVSDGTDWWIYNE